jgi:tRNA(adenine34) deaminase
MLLAQAAIKNEAIMSDADYMQLALVQARQAAEAGEVPVGAVLVRHGQVIATGCNNPISGHDPTAHAEMQALRSAAQAGGNYRLDECELFVTLEPCAMCAGAMLHARLKRVVFGAADPKTGAAGSVLDLFGNARLNHQTQVAGGLLAAECAAPLQSFFKAQRQRQALAASPLREDALRTPMGRFETLPPMPGVSVYVDDLPSLKGLRLHYVDAGPTDPGQVIVCLHGSGSWSQVWQPGMAEHLAQGARVVVPDLIGFGKSDKPKKGATHQVAWHAQVLSELLERLDLRQVLLLESAADAVRESRDGAPPGQSLGQLLMALADQRVLRRESCVLPAMAAAALVAPFPDDGHRAGVRALAPLARPAVPQRAKKKT